MLMRRSVDFLGHVVSDKGIHANADKINTVCNWPTPQSVHDVRSFLGLCSYYRKFVLNFAVIASPLHRLTEKYTQFVWTDVAQKAFDDLKTALTSPPILAMPTLTDKYVLDTDASDFCIGAVLSQVQDGEERVIAYASRTLSRPERNYCVTRRELLALVYFVKEFRCYLLGQRFLIRTDHAALQWLQKTPDPVGQQARWLNALSEYDFEIQHRPGKSHGNADAMSRRPQERPTTEHTSDEPEVLTRAIVAEQQQPLSDVALRTATRTDETTSPLLLWLTQPTAPNSNTLLPYSAELKALVAQWKDLRLVDNLIYRQYHEGQHTIWNQLIVPEPLRQQFISRTTPRSRWWSYWCSQNL